MNHFYQETIVFSPGFFKNSCQKESRWLQNSLKILMGILAVLLQTTFGNHLFVSNRIWFLSSKYVTNGYQGLGREKFRVSQYLNFTKIAKLLKISFLVLLLHIYRPSLFRISLNEIAFGYYFPSIFSISHDAPDLKKKSKVQT